MRFYFWMIGLLALLVAALASLRLAGQAPLPVRATSLPALVEELLANNPELKSLTAKIHASHANIGHHGIDLADPKVGVELKDIPTGDPSLSRSGMSGIEFSASQEIPFPGKLRQKKKIARAQAEQTVLEMEEQKNQLIAKFKSAYFDYRYATEALAIAEQRRDRLLALARTLENSYASGTTEQLDVLQAKKEVAEVEMEWIELDQSQKTSLAQINALLVRPEETPLVIEATEKKLTEVTVPLDKLEAMAAANRPWLKRQDWEIKQSQSERTLSKMNLLPDFDFMGAYRYRSDALKDEVFGENFFSAGVKINVPIFAFRKQAKEIAMNRHQLTAAKEMKTALSQEVLFQVRKAYGEENQLRSQYEILATKIVPLSRAAFTSAQHRYEAGLADFSGMVRQEESLYQEERAAAQTFYEHEKKVAELEMVTGGKIYEDQ